MSEKIVEEINSVFKDNKVESVEIYLSDVTESFKISDLKDDSHLITAKLVSNSDKVVFEPDQLNAFKIIYKKTTHVNFMPL